MERQPYQIVAWIPVILQAFSHKRHQIRNSKTGKSRQMAQKQINTNTMPKMPKKPPRKINPYFSSRNGTENSSLGIAKELSALNATTTTVIRTDQISPIPPRLR